MHGKLAQGNLPLEACPIDSRFDLHMEYENLTPGELGLVLTALGLGETRFLPKLGGGKPACLGTIEIMSPLLTKITPNAAYADFDITAQSMDVAPLLEAAKPLVLNSQLGKLADVLRWPREDRECPDQSY